MSTEVQMLVWSIFLGIAQIILATTATTKKYGIKWNISSRGETMPPVSGSSARLVRAAENFKETFPFFIAAVVSVQLLGKNSDWTAYGAQLYFWARLLYVPIYALDIVYIRTLVWCAATAGILMVAAAPLTF